MSYDYPSKQELHWVSAWDNDLGSWFTYIRSLWWAPEWGWTEERGHDELDERPVTRFRISTGGWSGNEDVIEAMQHSLGWFFTWVQSRRGGHYIFELPDALESFKLGPKEAVREG